MLYDLGVVSTAEPFRRLVSQGMILGEVEFTAHRDPDSGAWVPEDAPGAEPVRRAHIRLHLHSFVTCCRIASNPEHHCSVTEKKRASACHDVQKGNRD